MIIIYGFLIYWVLAAVGITYGYHRYFAHRQFRASAITETIMLYFGLLCGGRSALTWAAVHRIHHAHADTDKDPHSPKNHPWYVVLFSLWRVKSIPRKYMAGLIDNPRVMFFHRYGLWILLYHWVMTFMMFGIDSLIVNTMLIVLSYVGFGVLNLFGHNAEGPTNNKLINIIAPFEGNHRDHHGV
jgi:fatty-acid desaturase